MEAVVVDVGSKLLKAGYAAPDQDPSLIIPTKMKRVAEDGDGVDPAEEVMVDPVVRGLVKDWDAMEDLMRHVLYTGLGWEIGDEGQILFADPLFTPKAIREQLVQLMFETFNISGFYATEQAVLSLYAVGRISGCAVDIGHGKLDIAPVCEGAVQHIASKRFEIGGVDLTELLAQELRKSNPQVTIGIDDVEKLKEQYACSAVDQDAFEETCKSCQIEEHSLPDGQCTCSRRFYVALKHLNIDGLGLYLVCSIWVDPFARLTWKLFSLYTDLKVIKIQKEKYLVGEALFQPSILGLEEYGIVEQLVRSISSVSSENHRQLLENTVLCGGTASIIGFEERFQKEANLCSSSIRPSLPPEYMPESLAKNSAWMGGSILAKVVFPQNQHITKAEYDETGPAIVHKKCF